MKYTLSQIAQITGGELRGSDCEVTSVSTDSRNHCPAQTLFVAINGVTHDAHKFLSDLATRGVRAFMVEQLPRDPGDGGYVVVRNSLEALQILAAHHRAQFTGTVVAITGSNGKTTVKEWFAALWRPENGRLTRSPRSYNSQLGVPLSLLQIEGDETLVIIEAGISKPGEMSRLEQIIHPDIVLFTNLGPAHSENFASPAQQLTEKEILFRRAKKVIKAPTSGTVEERNLACVLDLYNHLGLSHDDPAGLQPVAMRLEVREGVLGSTIINDSYNSDLASLAIALDFAVANQGGGNQGCGGRVVGAKKAVILSDILQNAGNPTDTYAEVARLVEAHGVTLFVGVGREVSRHASLFENIAQTHFYPTTAEALVGLQKHWFRDAVVLLKGSRPFGFEKISAALESRTHTTVLEVDLNAMAENLNANRALLSEGVKTMAMVKAGGYGTGTVEVASMLQHQRVDYLAVAFADEGIELRQHGIHLPIVVLNADNGSFAAMIQNNLEPEIYSFASLQSFIAEVRSQGAAPQPIHIKLDTGMHRLGFMADQIPQLIEILAGQNAVRVGSIFSHLAASEDPAEDDFTRAQIALYKSLSKQIIDALQPLQNVKIIRHICNSAAIERFAEAHMDMVRLGIGLYASPRGVVCRLKTRVVQVKSLNAGETVGYNRRGVVDQPKKIAIIPIGYADGLARLLGNGHVSFAVCGTLCPTIGNICMDTTILDVTGVPEVREGDTVEIFGDNPTLDQIAAARGTIPYEVLTSVAARIKRLYVSN